MEPRSLMRLIMMLIMRCWRTQLLLDTLDVCQSSLCSLHHSRKHLFLLRSDWRGRVSSCNCDAVSVDWSLHPLIWSHQASVHQHVKLQSKIGRSSLEKSWKYKQQFTNNTMVRENIVTINQTTHWNIINWAFTSPGNQLESCGDLLWRRSLRKLPVTMSDESFM